MLMNSNAGLRQTWLLTMSGVSVAVWIHFGSICLFVFFLSRSLFVCPGLKCVFCWNSAKLLDTFDSKGALWNTCTGFNLVLFRLTLLGDVSSVDMPLYAWKVAVDSYLSLTMNNRNCSQLAAPLRCLSVCSVCRRNSHSFVKNMAICRLLFLAEYMSLVESHGLKLKRHILLVNKRVFGTQRPARWRERRSEGLWWVGDVLMDILIGIQIHERLNSKRFHSEIPNRAYRQTYRQTHMWKEVFLSDKCVKPCRGRQGQTAANLWATDILYFIRHNEFPPVR